MKEEIQVQLSAIEQDHNVKILLACESGSHAWGFPSQDSDYDVRFIYAHSREWYLSVFEKRDVIELPVQGLLDVNVWDIRKALALFRNSNPAFMEWRSSPIVYRTRLESLEPFCSLAERAFLPTGSCQHYLSMARFIRKQRVRLKSYLYSLRPILCCKWVIKYGTQPPMLFLNLVQEFLPEGAVHRIVDQLVAIKSSSREADTVDCSKILEEYLGEELDSLIKNMPDHVVPLPEREFDETFRVILDTLQISDYSGSRTNG